MKIVRPLAYLPDASLTHALAISAVLGIKIHFVETMQLEPSNIFIEGVTPDSIAFISFPGSTKYPVLWVVGHEMWHAGEHLDKNMFESALETVLSECESDMIEFRRQFEPDPTVTDRHVKSEVLADLNGEMWIDPLFWLELAAVTQDQKANELFGSMASILDGEPLQGRFGLGRYKQDSATLRKILVNVWYQRLLKSR